MSQLERNLEGASAVQVGEKSKEMNDRFSNHASGYAAFRPTYPKELYEFILSQVNEKQCAWDCGTGNGQVARDLAPHFQIIMATDTSEKQLEHALVLPIFSTPCHGLRKRNFNHRHSI